MPPRVSREEWDRRAAAVGIEWVGGEPIYATKRHVGRCLTCGREWECSPHHVYGGMGCRPCSDNARRLTRTEWDRRAAEIGIEWVGDEPIDSMQKRAARCLTCEHQWARLPSCPSGCPECARGYRVSRDEWDRRAAAVGIEWVGDDPIYVARKHSARCLKCAYEWEVRVAGIKAGRGCPVCAITRMRLAPEEWDLRAAAAGIEWVGDEPIRKRYRHAARCLRCRHEWEAWPANVAQGQGCKPCADNARRLTRTEWDRRAAEIGIEWVGSALVESVLKHEARCLGCGHEWDVVPSSVVQGHGCPVCAPLGFNPGAPGTVYLIRHDAGPYMKVGITGADPTKRLDGWTGLGWDVLATWPIRVGRDAEVIERAVIAWWKQSGATRCKRDELPEGQGWTEAVHITAAADEPRTLAYIEELVAEVGGGY